MVFSYFTGTIDYLAERLSGLLFDGRPLRILKLYGPMNSAERDRAVASFRDHPGPVVLLSSEVGSEGLDFQFCSRMFNYDLPWNPMRVEQRIGRLDRYGQTSEIIHILNMIVTDTIEERIFHRLYDRIRIFESSMGISRRSSARSRSISHRCSVTRYRGRSRTPSSIGVAT